MTTYLIDEIEQRLYRRHIVFSPGSTSAHATNIADSLKHLLQQEQEFYDRMEAQMVSDFRDYLKSFNAAVQRDTQEFRDSTPGKFREINSILYDIRFGKQLDSSIFYKGKPYKH